MSEWLEYLSGNVPGGIYLLAMVLLIVAVILLFMLRVNELFTMRHFRRILPISFSLITVLYILLWMQNPPAAVYQRYAIDLFETDSEQNWLGYRLTDALTGAVEWQDGAKSNFIPYDWFFKIAKSDVLADADFRKGLWENIPVGRVLSGRVSEADGKWLVNARLSRYPGDKLIAEKKFEIPANNIVEFRKTVSGYFSSRFPFKNSGQWAPPDKMSPKLMLAKIAFFDKNYDQALTLLANENDASSRIWREYSRIRRAAHARAKDGRADPLASRKAGWQTEFAQARSELLTALKNGYRDRWINNIVAESYLWEEKFESAEVFLENALLQNPSDVEVLLNLSFLHPTRYGEFGFKLSREIYQKILAVFPAYESVLIKWSEYILKNNPAYTAPPEFARNYLQKYLRINPLSAQVWSMLGKLLAQQRSRIEAQGAFLTADSLDPNNAVTQYDLGILFYEWEKLDEAQTYFEKAIAINDLPDAHLYLGAIYRQRGEYEKALAEFRYRVKHKSGDDDVYAVQAMRGIRECLAALAQGKEQGQ